MKRAKTWACALLAVLALCFVAGEADSARRLGGRARGRNFLGAPIRGALRGVRRFFARPVIVVPPPVLVGRASFGRSSYGASYTYSSRRTVLLDQQTCDVPAPTLQTLASGSDCQSDVELRALRLRELESRRVLRGAAAYCDSTPVAGRRAFLNVNIGGRHY